MYTGEEDSSYDAAAAVPEVTVDQESDDGGNEEPPTPHDAVSTRPQTKG